ARCATSASVSVCGSAQAMPQTMPSPGRITRARSTLTRGCYHPPLCGRGGETMLDAHALDVLFREAHSTHAFTEPVTDEQLRGLYDLMKWGPTVFNTQPGRFVFVRSKGAKEKLAPALSPANLDKTMQAPVTVIVAYDLRFYENLPKTFPHRPDANKAFMGDEKLAHAERTALRNGSLQGAYLIIAARAVGLSCGPMSGF